MDVFKLLSRGATIKKNQLEIFQQEAPKVEASTDFFGKHKPKRQGAGSKEAAQSAAESAPEDTVDHRATHRIKIKGSDVPAPLKAFEGLSDNLKSNLVKYNFSQPTPIQSEAIPALLAGRDLLACAPTGSGKTLAFTVPILSKLEGTKGLGALIVTPTRELSGQIYQVACELAPRGVIVAHLNKQMLGKLRNNNAGKKRNMHLLVATPQRLIEAVQQGLIDLAAVQTLILDESDRLLGDGFVQQTDEIIAACTASSLTKAIFSATMPANVEELAASIMHNPIRIIVGLKEAASENVEQKLVFCGNEQGKLTGIRQMLQGGDVVPPILVFVQSIERAKALFNELLYDKVSVDVIHSDLTQSQRDRAVNSFKNGDIWVLVCTDVLSRGVDFHGVNLVINYDIPLNAQSYVHRVGRTGRAGRKGKAITFYTKQDLDSVHAVANVMRQSGCDVPEWLAKGGKKRTIPVARDIISTNPGAQNRAKAEAKARVKAKAGAKSATGANAVQKKHPKSGKTSSNK